MRELVGGYCQVKEECKDYTHAEVRNIKVNIQTGKNWPLLLENLHCPDMNLHFTKFLDVYWQRWFCIPVGHPQLTVVKELNNGQHSTSRKNTL